MPTKIRWTEETWNPITGCTKVSPGCDHCYAETLTRRFPDNFPNGFNLTTYPGRLEMPLHWKKPRRIFVNSMSDLFHEKLPMAFIEKVFESMEKADWHNYQVLTKRPWLMADYFASHPWHYSQTHPRPSGQIWLGTSVETASYKFRIDQLRKVPCDTRFLSLEPLLGDLGPLDLTGIEWVIVGGESGPGFRKMELDWARIVRDQCMAQGVAFFYKQCSGIRTEMNPELDGRRWEQYPAKGTSPA